MTPRIVAPALSTTTSWPTRSTSRPCHARATRRMRRDATRRGRARRTGRPRRARPRRRGLRGSTDDADVAEPAVEPAARAVLASAARPARREAGQAARKAPWWELPALVVLAILIAILVKTFVVQPFYIPSESMEKTLHGCTGCSGDRILVNKPIYDLRDPHPGDIVVFNAPQDWNDRRAGHAAAEQPDRARGARLRSADRVRRRRTTWCSSSASSRSAARPSRVLRPAADTQVMISDHGAQARGAR